MKREQLSKHDKYTTKNPISNFLVSQFLKNLGELFMKLSPVEILDVGCGEGLVLHYLNDLKKIDKCYAIDHNEIEVMDAKRNIPFCNIEVGSIYDIPFKENFADLVICSEVLEHLEYPQKAIEELYRVTREYALISVPREPIWRMLNMARFKYWNELGNTPDHKNHWNAREFMGFVDPYFEIMEKRQPLPWTILLCRKRS